jgi:DNA-binding response OmpR family regulator
MTDPRPLVLIADDDMEIRALVRRALGDLDCDLIEAFDGEDALEKIIVEAPDLVVLDVMMPTLTGWEICKYIRSKPHLADTRVVMLTAVGKTVNELTSPLYGADAYLDKPFDLKELAAEVKRLLDEQAAEDADE